jgi:hypothetical protein
MGGIVPKVQFGAPEPGLWITPRTLVAASFLIKEA